MRAMIEWTRRLTGTFRRSRTDEDLAEELRSHLVLAAEEHARRGLSGPESIRAARARGGGIAQALEALRDQRSVPRLESRAGGVVFGLGDIVRQRTPPQSARRWRGFGAG